MNQMPTTFEAPTKQSTEKLKLMIHSFLDKFYQQFTRSDPKLWREKFFF